MLLFKPLIAIAGLVGAVYLSLCLGLRLGQRWLIFAPSPTLEPTPAQLGLLHDEIWIQTGPNPQARLHGWWLPVSGDAAAPALLYLHGNAGNISTNLTRAAWMRSSLGVSVLLIDYRGYGLSSGPFPSEQRLYNDARAAWEFLRQGKGLAAADIAIYGHSIGGAVAIDLAVQVPDGLGLIVENSFTSMADMAHRAGYGRWVPVDWVLTQRFDSRRKLAQLDMPLLLIHGEADQTIPVQMGRELYAIAPDPKQLWLVPQADHNNLVEVAGPAYADRLTEFLTSAMEQPYPNRRQD